MPSDVIRIANQITELHHQTKQYYDGSITKWHRNANHALCNCTWEYALRLRSVTPTEDEHMIAKAVMIIAFNQKEIDYSWKEFIETYAVTGRIMCLCKQLETEAVSMDVCQFIKKEFLSKPAFKKKISQDKRCWEMLNALQTFVKLYIRSLIAFKDVKPLIAERKIPKFKLTLLLQLCRMQIYEDVELITISYHGMDKWHH